MQEIQQPCVWFTCNYNFRKSRYIYAVKIWQVQKKKNQTDNQLHIFLMKVLPLPPTLRLRVWVSFNLDALDQLYETEAYNVAPHWFRCNTDTCWDRPWDLYVVQERRALWWWGKIWFLSKVPLSWEQNLLSSLIRIISICVSVISVIDAFLGFTQSKANRQNFFCAIKNSDWYIDKYLFYIFF